MKSGRLGTLIGLLVMSPLIWALSPTDDLTKMTPEQRRAYLEEYLRKLKTVEPDLSDLEPVAVEVPQAVAPAPEPEVPQAVAPAPEPEVPQAVAPAPEPEVPQAVAPTPEPEVPQAVAPTLEPEVPQASAPLPGGNVSSTTPPAVIPSLPVASVPVLTAPVPPVPLPSIIPPVIETPRIDIATPQVPKAPVFEVVKGISCGKESGPALMSPFGWLTKGLHGVSLNFGETLLSASQPSLAGAFNVLVNSSEGGYLGQRCNNDEVSSVKRYASARYVDGIWKVEVENGLRFDGVVLVPTSDGFLLDQGGGLIHFKLGAEPVKLRIPSGYRLADVQNTDIAESKTVLLLSKDLMRSEYFVDGRLGVLPLKTGQSDLQKTDFAAVFYNIDNGRVWKFEVDAQRLKSGLVGKCRPERWKSGSSCGLKGDRDWILSDNGNRDVASYFSLVHWVGTSKGFDVLVFDPTGHTVSVESIGGGQPATRQKLPSNAIGAFWKRLDGKRARIVLEY